MRNKHLLLALVVVLLPPAFAGAATLDRLTATADCNAWNAEATVVFRVGAVDVLLVLSMQLADSTGVEIERYDNEQWLVIPASGTAVYPFGAAWATPLDRPASMTVTASVYDARGDRISLTEGDVVVALDCPVGTPVEVCRHASRWWRRHVAEWPVSSLTLGGVTYDQARLQSLLRAHHHGQINRRLTLQLAVTKLNLANGVTNDIADQVAAADAWLGAHPLVNSGRRSEPGRDARREGLRLVKDLCRWNHATCVDGAALTGDEDGDDSGKSGLSIDFGATGMEFTGDLADFDGVDKAAEENVNLGTLKAMYR